MGPSEQKRVHVASQLCHCCPPTLPAPSPASSWGKMGQKGQVTYPTWCQLWRFMLQLLPTAFLQPVSCLEAAPTPEKQAQPSDMWSDAPMDEVGPTWPVCHPRCLLWHVFPCCSLMVSGCSDGCISGCWLACPNVMSRF